MRANHRYFLSFLLIIARLAAAAFLPTACDVGLGSKINTQVPVISGGPGGSQPGSYLHGDRNIVQLDIRQEFGISSVFMTIWYNDRNKTEKQIIVPANHNDGYWAVNIDTTDMADGSIRAQATAVDVGGKITTTTDLIYIVKNNPPQIELTLPKIKGNSFDLPNLNNILNDAPLYQGNDIMGIASDAFGIEEGFPQILIWPKDYNNVDRDGIVLESDRKWGQWRTMVDENYKPLNTGGLNAVQFRWPLIELVEDGTEWRLPERDELLDPVKTRDLPVGAYRVKIRVTDNFGVVNVYPNRSNNSFNLPETSQSLNQYMEINLVAAKNPSIRWHSFPQYYNGEEDFTATVNITTPNDRIDTIRVMASNNEDAVFTYAGNSFVKRSDAGNSWVITITPEIMREMLSAPHGQKMAGEKILHIEAVDNMGNKASSTRQFIIDDIAPSLEFIEPVELTKLGTAAFKSPRLSSTVTIRGAAIDNQRVSRLYYALGKTEVNALSGGNAQSSWSDSGLHDTPADHHKGLNARWGGSLSNWSWRFDDIADVCKGKDAAYYVESYNTNQNLWLLPVKFKVVDVAGNTNIYYAEIIVDPDADNPVVSISSHNERQIVGGMVRVSGLAADNEWINKVEIKITAQSDANCGTANLPDTPKTGGRFVPANITGNKSAVANWFFNINENGDLNPPKGKTREVLLEIRAWDASMYSQNIAKNFSETRLTLVFDLSVPVIEDVIVIHNDGKEEVLLPGTTIKEFVTLKARVRDDSGITSIKLRGQGEAGYSEYIDKNVSFNARPWVIAPNELHAGDLIRAGKKYWIKESHGSDFSGFQAAGYKSNGKDTTFIAVKDGFFTGASVLVESNASDGVIQYFEYIVYIPLNTNAPSSDLTSLRGGFYHNSAAPYSIDIQVIDNTNPMPFITLDSFSLQIDNYYPMASIYGNLNAAGSYQIFGKAWDTGGAGINVQGLNRVVVYFSRNGKLISLLNGTEATALNKQSQTAKTSRFGNHNNNINPVINEGTLTLLPFFPNVKQNGGYSTNEYGIVIDSNHSGPYSPRFSGPAADKDWQITYPSANLSDGPLTVHYVVFDNADNATHYSRDLYIANNKPLITSISLGTDVDGSGTVQSDEYVDFTSAAYPEIITGGELTLNFRVRNSRFKLNLNTAGGNGGINYRVSYVKRSETAVSVANILKGEVYSIIDPGNGINWIDYGVLANPSAGVVFTASHSHSELAALGLASGGGGTVYKYEHIGDRSKTGKEEKNLSHNAQIVFNADSFGGAGGIEDSVKDMVNGVHVPRHDRLFLIKVYDSTVSLSEENQLAHAVVIKLAVDNNDITPPVILINPFYWNGANDNSLYNYSRDNGHIELEAHLPLSKSGIGSIDDMDPKISGRVSFRGTASDNNVIELIKFNIGNFQNGDVITAARFNGKNWISDSNSEEEFANNGWMFSASGVPEQTGHTVNWRLDFDSGFINGGAGADNVLTVTAADKALNSSSPGSYAQTTMNARTAYYRFDAVPYITEIVTELSGAYISIPSAFNRSALGGYPVSEGETIKIKGFNLNGASTIAKTGGKELNVTGFIKERNNVTQITAVVDERSRQGANNTITSGDLTVIVNGISSINNINNDNTQYNQEPNGLNNNILNDNRRLYVWNTGFLLNQRVVQSPFMRMSPDAVRFMSYGLYDGNGRLYVRKNNDPAAHNNTTEIEHWENRYLNTAVAFDDNNDWYAASSNMTGLNYPNFTFYARAQATGTNGSIGTNKRIIMHMAYGQNQFDINRAKIPRIFAQNTENNARGSDAKATRIFLSYYDNGSSDNPVLFHYGTVGGNNNFHGNLQNNNNDNFTKHPQAQVVANNSTAYKGSMYTAVGALSNGLPVIAWYDRYSQSLIFSHGGGSNSAPLNGTALETRFNSAGSIVVTETGAPGVPGTWQGNAVKIADFAGTHVDMVVDEGDNVHLAYYDVRNGGLHYAYIPALNANTITARPDTNSSRIQKARVDTYLSAGTKLMLNVRREGNLFNGRPKYVPYISYFHASFAETKNSIRVAWRRDFSRSDFNGTDSNDRYTGAWEVMTIPVETVPLADEFICHGVPTAANWVIPGGGSSLHYNVNINKTILTGYMTTNWYEGAVLKDELW